MFCPCTDDGMASHCDCGRPLDWPIPGLYNASKGACWQGCDNCIGCRWNRFVHFLFGRFMG